MNSVKIIIDGKEAVFDSAQMESIQQSGCKLKTRKYGQKLTVCLWTNDRFLTTAIKFLFPGCYYVKYLNGNHLDFREANLNIVNQRSYEADKKESLKSKFEHLIEIRRNILELMDNGKMPTPLMNQQDKRLTNRLINIVGESTFADVVSSQVGI